MNPYEPPRAPIQPPHQASAELGRCPQCNGTNVRSPGFTWWGGAIGSRLLSHRVCGGCGFGFNAKTGRSNTMAIITYQVVVLFIGLVLFFVLRS